MRTALALRQGIWRKGRPYWHICGIRHNGTFELAPDSRCWLLSWSPTATQPVWRSRPSTRHHQDWQRLSAKSVDRVFQPYPPAAWKGLGASTVGPHLASRGGSRPGIRRLLQSRASWQCCSIVSGPPKNHTRPSTQKLLEGYLCSPVATTPCSDHCERVWAFQDRREMAASTLLSNPNRHRACIKTAHPECE
jgi:hypothetical protein